MRQFLIRRGGVLALTLSAMFSASAVAATSGAIFTTVANGTIVNANIYNSKCAVYLDGGPGPQAKATAAGLPDGDYFFQVTDPNGNVLLSTDPVSNRKFHVQGGVITASLGTHATAVDQDHAAQGARTIQVANTNCPADYLDTPNTGGVYKVWATPVADYVGNPANVDNPCSGSCSHGFVHSKSKTDNFKVLNGSTATFCLTLQKRFQVGTTISNAEGWLIDVTDPLNVTNHYSTLLTGDYQVCQLSTGNYTVSEDVSGATVQPVPPGCSLQTSAITSSLNGVTQPNSTSVSFNWTATSPLTMTVQFVNTLICDQ